MSADALLATLRMQAAPFVALRRDIHRHPELGLQEHRTSALVAEAAEVLGEMQNRRRFAGTIRDFPSKPPILSCGAGQ